MAGVLSKIKGYKLGEIEDARRATPEAVLLEEVSAADAPRGFLAALRARREAGERALIAEVKKASPSKGLIRERFDPAGLAAAYARAGATCLSVLTDTPSFQGSRADLAAAHAACPLPLLRKDFLFDTYQVTQSRAWGADCVLVILAAVDDQLARDLLDAAAGLGMDAIVEVHDEAELERAVALDAAIVGINNRNLVTFETTLATTERLAPLVPPGRLVIGESGLSSVADLDRMSAAGVTTYLIGESLLRHDDVEQATRTLLTPTSIRA